MLRFATALLVLPGIVMALAGRPHPPRPTPLPLDDSGVEKEATLRDESGRIVIANLRVVEQGRLYRASAFPANGQRTTPAGTAPYPAALLGPTLFEALRARNVHEVVTLEDDEDDFYAEEGYFKYWADQTGYVITVTWLAVPPGDAYARNDRSGLHAGAMLVSMMQRRGPGQGAVLVHGDTGKDATGVAVAVYEAWRDQGWMERETRWRAITERYLASNRLLRETGPFAGAPVHCPSGQDGYVCPEWLAALRNDIEYIAKL